MKKAIQFGAGNIGRGFIGGLLSNAGYHVVFADVNMTIIDRINADKKYTIYVKDVESSEQIITDISGVDSTKPEVIREIKDAEIITTAVGLQCSSNYCASRCRRNQSKNERWFRKISQYHCL